MNPRQKKITLLLTPFLWLVMFTALYLLTPAPVSAHDCLSDPLNAADCMRTPGFRTIITVGIAVAGTLSAIATELASQAAQAASQGQQPPEETVYVMNLSEDTFELKPGESHTINITTWKVTAAGYVPEPAAQLLIYPPPGFENCMKLVITGTPDNWQATYTLTQAANVETATSQVAVTFPKGSKTGTVTINLPPPPGFVVKPVNFHEIAYNTTQKKWLVPELVCYFNNLFSSGPVKTNFKISFGDPPFNSDVDIFDNYQVYTTDEGLTYNISFDLKSGINLEDYFGPDLGAKDGRINIRVDVVADDEKKTKYSAKTVLTVTPQYRFVVYSYEQDVRVPSQGHTYQEIEFEEGQLALDGEDELILATLFVRTDKEITPGDEYADARDIAQVRAVRWDPVTDGASLRADLDADNSDELAQTYKVGAKRLLQYSKETKPGTHRLLFDLEIKPGKPKNFRLVSREGEYKLYPQYTLLRMWVVPGILRGTSEALAYLSLEPCRKPLPQKNIELSIDCSGGVSVALESCDAVQATSELDRGSRGGAFVPKGAALWTLRYSGLSWSNLPGATFTVRGALQDKDGNPTTVARSVTINLLDNVNNMLEELFNDPKLAKEINNSYWNSEPATIEFFRGPLWNIAQKFDTSGPFVCFRMRDKITEWALMRRHYDKPADPRRQMAVMKRMNGLEFDYYASRPVHVWAGFFLSSMGKYGDYAALDPWWGQHWKNPDYKDYTKLRGKWGERARIYGTYAMVAVLAVVLVKLLAIYGIATSLSAAVSAIYAWLTGASVAQILAILGISAGADAVSYTADSDLTDGAGRYQGYLAGWPIAFLRFISQSEPSGEDL